MHELANRDVTFVHRSMTYENCSVDFVVRHGLYFRRMVSSQYCSDLFDASLYRLKLDKKANVDYWYFVKQ